MSKLQFQEYKWFEIDAKPNIDNYKLCFLVAEIILDIKNKNYNPKLMDEFLDNFNYKDTLERAVVKTMAFQQFEITSNIHKTFSCCSYSPNENPMEFYTLLPDHSIHIIFTITN